MYFDMNDTSPKQIELRSEKMRRIMGTIPHHLIIWSGITLAMISLALLTALLFWII